MFNKIREKIKFLRWAYEHRNCTSKDFVVPINLIRKNIVPKRYHAAKIMSISDAHDATKMYHIKKSIAEELAHMIFPTLCYKAENMGDGFCRISADVLLGDENDICERGF